MKDYRLPVAVTIPAAIGLVGVLWLLRRKSSSKGDEKKVQKALPNDKEQHTWGWDSKELIEQQTQHIATEGITISQRKIPETLARNRGSSDLECKESVELNDSVLNQCQINASEKLDVDLESYLDVEQEIDISQEGQVQNLKSAVVEQNDQGCSVLSVMSYVDQDNCMTVADISHRNLSKTLEDVRHIEKSNNVTLAEISQIDKGNSVTLVDISEINQDNLTLAKISEIDKGNSVTLTEISQTDKGNSVSLVDIPLIDQGNSLISSDVNKDLQDVKAAITQHSPTPVIISEYGRGGSLTSPDITHFEQDSGFKPVPFTKIGQENRIISSNIVQGDALISLVSTQGDQGDVLTSAITKDVQDNIQTSVASKDGQNDVLTSVITKGDDLTSLITKDDVGDDLTSVVTKDDVGDDLTSVITKDDVGDDLTSVVMKDDVGVITEDDVGDDLTSFVTKDDVCDDLTSVVTKDDVSNDMTSVVTKDDVCDDLTSVISRDDVGDDVTSVISKVDQGKVLTSVITKDGWGDNLTKSDVLQIGQGDYVTASTTKQIGQDNMCITKSSEVIEYSKGESLTLSQKVYIEQQIITAMGDGLKEAHNKLFKPASHSESVKAMSPDSLMPDNFSRDEQSVGCEVMEEVQIHKAPTSGFQTAVHTNHYHESDLNMTICTSDVQSELTIDLTSKPEVTDYAADNEIPVEVSELFSTASSDSIIELENTSTQQKLSTVSLQEASKSQLLLTCDSEAEADSQPHVNIDDHAVDHLSPNKILKEDEHENQSNTMNSSISEPVAELKDAGTDNTSLNATENSGSNNINASVSTVKNLSCEQDEIRSPARQWFPKASTSSIDSFGPEEIEAIWGIHPSIENLDAELCFADTDSVVLPSDTSSLLSQKASSSDLDVKQDALSLSGSSSSKNVQSCDNLAVPFSDKSLKDESLAKSDSPTCDNNSEGSNDSGRGGSEHDMVCQGGEALVHFNFNMPSELCGQFIGRHGKNINFLKSKTGAQVSLTNNPFTPEYQVCQIVGTQAEVDDALNMIRRKFPLQDYPLLTMVPINMSGPVPLQPDNQLVFPDVMQLSLPEGVSVEVFVSAVVDAGQVFIQQPTHRSFMSLEKMNYFLNMVYGQEPNVPSVPTPVESGIICVCESEGFWYRAMIMSSEDENGEVQVKFVDYGGYVTMPVFALKQIRADFMSLPFQAVECFMANITPNQNERFFSDEATQALSEMTQGKLLQCQVVARTEYGIPYIHLYQINSESSSAVLINRALVNSRLVRWIEIL